MTYGNWENSYRVWSVEGSTEGTSQGAQPRRIFPKLIPTHEVGITHTLEQMSESINNTIQTELPRSGPRGVAVTYTALV